MDWPTNADLVLTVFISMIGIVVSAGTTIFELSAGTGDSAATVGALGARALAAALAGSAGAADGG
jgi:hypothetical protein